MQGQEIEIWASSQSSITSLRSSYLLVLVIYHTNVFTSKQCLPYKFSPAAIIDRGH
uniref:Uncharacterized protein n=1 Tax=Rhizophora mucronata TaxID=61149 RepID=A0A2P2NGK3_RHIMU